MHAVGWVQGPQLADHYNVQGQDEGVQRQLHANCVTLWRLQQREQIFSNCKSPLCPINMVKLNKGEGESRLSNNVEKIRFCYCDELMCISNYIITNPHKVAIINTILGNISAISIPNCRIFGHTVHMAMVYCPAEFDKTTAYFDQGMAWCAFDQGNTVQTYYCGMIKLCKGM